MAVLAVQAIRRMRGGAQSQLMLGADGKLWVVKFQNNPQHVRVLANEYLATRMAEAIGLPVPDVAVIEVSDWLIENTEDLRHEFAGDSEKVSSGLQFGSRYVVDPKEGQAYDYLPEMFFDRVRNLGDFLGMLCFDKWTCNANGRQAVYWKRNGRERKYNVTFVDQGYCFNAHEWTFPDAPLRGVYARNAVYEGVKGWESFEPWLTRIREMPMEKVWKAAEEMPPEWYECDDAGLWRVIEELGRRREKVAELIHDFRKSARNPFPGWVEKGVGVM